ncbi:hypothetical protein NDU88_001503 [Pleurodeles waltl]|uniref:Uncharacterized protein n=1 Tax=Pleurodeles waltl TaxID=8319 RepID=A0AAV7SBT5_PLEWA|nr:hypothetical protein NDU88_001503 [Pleurodeles waltl]
MEGRSQRKVRIRHRVWTHPYALLTTLVQMDQDTIFCTKGAVRTGYCSCLQKCWNAVNNLNWTVETQECRLSQVVLGVLMEAVPYG